MALNPLNSLMSISKQQLMKGKIYKRKSKAIDKKMQKLSTTMEQVHTVKKHRACYKEYKANPSDKAFFEEYKAQITLYESALSDA